MNAHEPLFWLVIITAIIAVSFLVIAAAMIAIAVFVKRAVNTVNRVEQKLDPLIVRANALSEQGQQIAEQVNVMSGHLSTATMHLSESAALIKEEVRGLTVLVDDTAEMAK